jgi:hypothetical protein
METKINWMALLVATLVGFAIGFIWYGLLFTDVWMAGNGITMDASNNMMKNGVAVEHSKLPMIINLITLFLYAVIINWLLHKTGSTTLNTGACIGGVLGTISLLGIYTGNRYAMNPTSLSMVDGFYMLILFTAMGAIIGAWRPK